MWKGGKESMQELNCWINLKNFIDAYNIVDILDFENRAISEVDIATQNQLSKSSLLYNRAINYIQSRRSEYIKKNYF